MALTNQDITTRKDPNLYAIYVMKGNVALHGSIWFLNLFLGLKVCTACFTWINHTAVCWLAQLMLRFVKIFMCSSLTEIQSQ